MREVRRRAHRAGWPDVLAADWKLCDEVSPLRAVLGDRRDGRAGVDAAHIAEVRTDSQRRAEATLI